MKYCFYNRYIVIPLMIFVMIGVFIPSIQALEEPVLSFSFDAPTMQVGDQQKITLMLSSGGYTQMSTVQASIHMDPQVVSIVDESIEVFPEAFPFAFKKEVQHDLGIINLSVSTIEPISIELAPVLSFIIEARQPGVVEFVLDPTKSSLFLADQYNSIISCQMTASRIIVEGELVVETSKEIAPIVSSEQNINSNSETSIPESEIISPHRGAEQTSPSPIEEVVLPQNGMILPLSPPLPPVSPSEPEPNIIEPLVEATPEIMPVEESQTVEQVDIIIPTSTISEITASGSLSIPQGPKVHPVLQTAQLFEQAVCQTPYNIRVSAQEDNVVLRWDNEDAQVRGYHLYIGNKSRVYEATQYIENVQEATLLSSWEEPFVIAITAVGTCLESPYSVEIEIARDGTVIERTPTTQQTVLHASASSKQEQSTENHIFWLIITGIMGGITLLFSYRTALKTYISGQKK